MSTTTTFPPSSPRKVIVVSSFNFDLTLHLHSFPLPHTTSHLSRVSTHLGGKGANTAIAASLSSAPTSLSAAVCQSDFESISSQLTSYNVNASLLTTVPTSTGRAFILLEPSGANRILVDMGANLHYQPPPTLFPRLHNSVVVLHLELPSEVVARMAREAKQANALVVMNPSPIKLDAEWGREGKSWVNVDIVVVNETEAMELTGCDGDWAKSAQIFRAWGAGKRAVVVTLGEEGVWWDEGKGGRRMAALQGCKVVDTTCAGDTFTGYMVGGLVKGWPFEKCIKWSVVAGGIAVAKEGAAESVPMEEVVESKVTEWEAAGGGVIITQ